PPPLNSSQSVISGFEKSPISGFKPSHSRNGSTGSSRHTKQTRDWEVLDDLQQTTMSVAAGSSLDLSIPGICEGYLMKGRKYPLKGWHKIQRGKLHEVERLDLDAGDDLYHMKAKSHELFYIWLTKLCAHRIFKKNEAMSVHRGVLHALSQGQGNLPSMASLAHRNAVSTPRAAAELARCQLELVEMEALVQRLHWLEGGPNPNPITDTDLEQRISMQNLSLEKPKKKSGKVFGHSRTLSRVEAMGGMFTSSHLSSNNSVSQRHLGASLQSIPDYVYTQLSNPQVTSPEAKKIQQDICVASQRVHASLKSVHEVLTLERERLRNAWNAPDLKQNTSHQLATLCSTLSELDVQSRLTKVHSLSLSSSDSTEESFCTVRPDQVGHVRTPSRRRPPSVADSMAEYFDASEVILCDSSSEAEASDESGLSDITTTSTSEPDEGHASATVKYRASVSSAPDKPRLLTDSGRRKILPASCTDNGHIGIMTILYNNIGKDLSRVSMPAALNEPLSLLQRLSEELEYSALLDTANSTDDPYQRMVYLATFSISGYAWASWRSRYKPFNPVLGETYENNRPDRGFRYVGEQVSHHPPVSACHADSENFSFWQDQRWKYKFWGKSAEIISSGGHYEWNKVVLTCIHNVLSPQRWLEHYGDVVIKNTQSDVCTCKITFVKSRYWSSDSSKNEVQGVVLDRAGEVVHRFGGLWHEGIFCDTFPTPQCIWKPNDHVKFYGFSQYARELNELTPDLEGLLPPTDSRYRPDQRLLEEGDVAAVDVRKDEVEEKQRERRKELVKQGEEHMPRFFRRTVDEAGREVWIHNGTYWNLRSKPGFANTPNPDLW
uniref:Oxysterol-binding protein n=1 Tax=Gadus morhua TaxID=8049 RepID=A0A8C5FFF9_GADMO